MNPENPGSEADRPQLGVGQVALATAARTLAPAEQVRKLSRLSDPELSELELDELLDELLERVHEALGVDTVAILLTDEESQQLVAHAAKGIEGEVEQGLRIPVGKGFAGRIAAERVAIFIPDVDHADVLNPVLSERGIRSLLGVPLIVEGELIGVLHVGSLQPRTFDQADLAILELAAARAAPAIERARLFSALEREHQVATVLQHSLLPRRLADVAGISVAARYLPARDEVGGDWYDVVELPRGQLGLAIGDVVGHGIRAAALMGQLRTALHAYAIESHGAGRTLELVDRFAQNMIEDAMATAAYAVFDPDTNLLTFALAGHLPPIVITPTESRVIDVTPTTPLGAYSYATCPEYALTLASAEMMVLYTDGLVERRGEHLSEGIEELRRVIADASSAEEACQLAVDAFVPPDGPTDDVAIVALQNTTMPSELRLQLQADPRVLSPVRRLLRRWLRDRGADGETVKEITLAVSEACANAIEHAYPPAPAAFELEASSSESVVTVAIRDHGRWRPQRSGTRGRGLTIIESAMDDVDVNSAPAGTEVVMRRRLESR